jgi:hypothetical protein
MSAQRLSAQKVNAIVEATLHTKWTTPHGGGVLGGLHWPNALHHIHVAHAVAPVAARHLFLDLGQLRDHRLGRDHEACDRGGVLERESLTLI